MSSALQMGFSKWKGCNDTACLLKVWGVGAYFQLLKCGISFGTRTPTESRFAVGWGSCGLGSSLRRASCRKPLPRNPAGFRFFRVYGLASADTPRQVMVLARCCPTWTQLGRIQKNKRAQGLSYSKILTPALSGLNPQPQTQTLNHIPLTPTGSPNPASKALNLEAKAPNTKP